jgi:AraC-like DNA-binding protein
MPLTAPLAAHPGQPDLGVATALWRGDPKAFDFERAFSDAGLHDFFDLCGPVSRLSSPQVWRATHEVRAETYVWQGLLGSIAHGRCSESQRLEYRCRHDLLILRASLSTSCLWEMPGLGAVHFSKPGIAVLRAPRGATVRFTVLADGRQDGMSAILKPDFLVEGFGLSPQALPPALRPGHHDGAASLLAELPMTADLAQLIEQQMHSSLRGELRRMQLRGSFESLVAMVIDAVANAPGFAGLGAARPRDIDMVQRVEQRLKRDYIDPPTLAELATDCGTNRNKLGQMFRAVHGTTPAEYCLRLRMAHAQTLLLQGRFNVAQIAERLGYAHQSSFATAFRDYCGMPPHAYAKRRPALAHGAAQSSSEPLT